MTASQTGLESSTRADVLKIETREGLNAIMIEVEDIIGTLQDLENMSPEMVSRMVERLTGILLPEWELTEWEQKIVDLLGVNDSDHAKVILGAVRDSKIYIVQQEIIGRIHPAYDHAMLQLRKADPLNTLDEDGRQWFVDFMDSEVEKVVRHYAFGDLRNFAPTREMLQAAQERIQDHAVATFLIRQRSDA